MVTSQCTEGTSRTASCNLCELLKNLQNTLQTHISRGSQKDLDGLQPCAKKNEITKRKYKILHQGKEVFWFLDQPL